MKLKGNKMGSLLVWALLLLSPHHPSRSLQPGWSITSLQFPPRQSSSPQVGLVPKSVPSCSFSLLTSWGEIPATDSQWLCSHSIDLQTLWHNSFCTPGWCFSPSYPHGEPSNLFLTKWKTQRPKHFSFLPLIFPQFWDASCHTESVPDFLTEQSTTGGCELSHKFFPPLVVNILLARRLKATISPF